MGAIPERLQSGYRGCESGWGAVCGGWDCGWGWCWGVEILFGQSEGWSLCGEGVHPLPSSDSLSWGGGGADARRRWGSGVVSCTPSSQPRVDWGGHRGRGASARGPVQLRGEGAPSSWCELGEGVFGKQA